MGKAANRVIVLPNGSGGADVIAVYLPSIPERLTILNAFNRALGYRERPHEDGAQMERRDADMVVEDVSACLCAILGASWLNHLTCGVDDPPPDLRACKRNAVVYGDAVYTWLWDHGYRNDAAIGEQAGELQEWWSEATFGLQEEVKAEQEDFVPAQL